MEEKGECYKSLGLIYLYERYCGTSGLSEILYSVCTVAERAPLAARMAGKGFSTGVTIAFVIRVLSKF